MPRTVKTIKDDKGNDIEVYSDLCMQCSKEMLFPREEADRLEELFPFLKQRIEAGSPCMECLKIKHKNDKDFSIFTEEEIEDIKKKIFESASSKE